LCDTARVQFSEDKETAYLEYRPLDEWEDSSNPTLMYIIPYARSHAGQI